MDDLERVRLRAEIGLLRAQRDALLAALQRISNAKADGLDHAEDVARLERAAKIASRAIAAAKETTMNQDKDPIAVLGGIEKAREYIIKWRSGWSGDPHMVDECRAAFDLALRAIDAVDPDHEAKIAAWRGNATSQTLDNWHDGPLPLAYVLDPHEIDEGVALMRSAPDGDAKPIGGPWGSMPEPNSCHVAEIDRLRAENARLQADLAAARADQAAMARRELGVFRKWLDLRGWHVDPAKGDGYAIMQQVDQRLAALPAQQPEPEPDAATRDGDEVLRRVVANHEAGIGHDVESADALAEVCRRELARGGK